MSDTNKNIIIELKATLEKAITPGPNASLDRDTIKQIKTALGPDNFEYFQKKYKLDGKNLDLDGLRILIIGVISNMNDRILKSDFLKQLCNATDVEITANAQTPDIITKLGGELNNKILNTETIDKIRKTPKKDFFNNFLRPLIIFFTLKNFRDLIPQHLKYSSGFKNDSDTAELAANIEKYTEKKDMEDDEKHKIRLKIISSEYSLHMMAYRELKNETIVPFVEETGEIKYYKTQNLLNNGKGLVSTVLVPIDKTTNPLDIKVLFRGTWNKGSTVMDLEQYGAGYKTYRENEKLILTNLNKILKNTKLEAENSGNTKPTISITSGGHSLGGALTQNFYSSLIKCKLLKLYKEDISKNTEELREKISLIVKTQTEYEAKVKLYKEPIGESLIEKRTNALLKSIGKLKEEKIDELKDLSTMSFSIMNSAGVAHKVRNIAADGLALLKSKENPKGITLDFTNIMVKDDPVQLTGQTTVSAGLKKENIDVQTIQIDSKYKEKILKERYEKKENFKDKLNKLLDSLKFKNIFNFKDILNNLSIVSEGAEDSLGLVSNGDIESLTGKMGTHGHVTRTVKEKNDDGIKIFNNKDDDSAKNQNKELTNKTNLTQTSLWQKLKKSFVRIMKFFVKKEGASYDIADITSRIVDVPNTDISSTDKKQLDNKADNEADSKNQKSEKLKNNILNDKRESMTVLESTRKETLKKEKSSESESKNEKPNATIAPK